MPVVEGLSKSCRVALVAVLALGACDDKKPSMAEAMKKADEEAAKQKAEAEEKKKAVKTEPTLADDPTKVEHPWNVDKVRSALQMGTVVLYKVSGTDAKGKAVTDQYRGEVKGTNENDVAIIQTLMSAADKPQAKQALSLPWDKVSPFFNVERATVELAGRETVEVPAGSFDSIKAELNGFFGAHITVWMPIEKPGVYAKVIDHGNANEEGDQTEMVYELESVTAPGG